MEKAVLQYTNQFWQPLKMPVWAHPENPPVAGPCGFLKLLFWHLKIPRLAVAFFIYAQFYFVTALITICYDIIDSRRFSVIFAKIKQIKYFRIH